MNRSDVTTNYNGGLTSVDMKLNQARDRRFISHDAGLETY